jgi:hypothetical protein
MPTLSFHRKGTAVGYMYITTIHREGTAWGWKGHKRAVGSRSGDPGPVIASGNVYPEVAQAERAADDWFYGIPNIVELTPDQGGSSLRPAGAAPAKSPAGAAPAILPTAAVPAILPPSPIEHRTSLERPASVREEANKGANFFGTATFAILASSILYELPFADDWPHKTEDSIFGVIAAAAACWYLWGKHRYSRSLVPLWFLILGLATKVIGVGVRTGRPIPVGPDLGISVSLILTSIVFGWQFYATRTRV